MTKRLSLLFVSLLLVSCDTNSFASNLDTSEDSSVTSQSEVVSSSSETTSPSSVTPLSSVDPYDELSVDGKRVVDALKKEGRYGTSYALLNFEVTLTYSFEYRFTYSPDNGVFGIYCKFIDKSFKLTGFVYFYWDEFKEGYFGGEYEHSGGYKLTDVEFTSLYFGTDFTHIDWRNATYESNIPNTEENHENTMIARLEKVFDALYDGLYFASEYLFNRFTPYIKLY